MSTTEDRQDRINRIYEIVQKLARFHAAGDEDFCQEILLKVLELPPIYWAQDEAGRPIYTDAFLAQRGALLARRDRYRQNRRKVQIFAASDFDDDGSFFDSLSDDDEVLAPQIPANLTAVVTALSDETQTVFEKIHEVVNHVPDPLAALGLAKREGVVTSLAQNGHFCRCRSCGRFATTNKPHVCPVAASPASLSRSLGRRIGRDARKLYGSERIEQLFDEASQHGGVTLIHIETQTACEAALAALPILMEAGYLPELWRCDVRHRVTGKNQVTYFVCDSAGLPPAPEPQNQTGKLADVIAPRGTVRLSHLAEATGFSPTIVNKHMKTLRQALAPYR